MDLKQLRYFTTLADAMNFHRAAERLNITQPPLTVAIRKLEAELGASLFVRGSRGVRLTTAGQAAIEPAREALAHAEMVRLAVKEGLKGQRGSLSIAFVGSAVSEVIPRLVPAFRDAYPRVELALEERPSVEIARGVAAHVFDVGLVRLPLMERLPLQVEVVERDVLVAAMLDSNPLAHRGELQLAELASQPFVMFEPISVLHSMIMLACQRVGFTPRAAQEAHQVQTILALVQSGLGVGLVPARMTKAVPEGIRLLPLRDPIEIEMGIAYRKDAGVLARNFVAMATGPSDT